MWSVLRGIFWNAHNVLCMSDAPGNGCTTLCTNNSHIFPICVGYICLCATFSTITVILPAVKCLGFHLVYLSSSTTLSTFPDMTFMLGSSGFSYCGILVYGLSYDGGWHLLLGVQNSTRRPNISDENWSGGGRGGTSIIEKFGAS